jgi:hypothetical protein
MNIKKIIKKSMLYLAATTIISLYSSSYILKMNGQYNYKVISSSQSNTDYNYPEDNQPSSDWLTFFQNNGYLSSFDVLSDWEWNETIIILNLSDLDLPQANLGISDIGYLRLGGAGITHIDFLQGVSSGTFLFYDTSITNVNAMSSVINANVIYFHNNNINDISGLSNLTTVDNGFYIFNNPAITDISPLENLTTVTGSAGFRIDLPSQYTTKAKLGSAFCNGIINETITPIIQQTSAIATVNELCE